MPPPRANVLRISVITLVFLLVIAAASSLRKPTAAGGFAEMPAMPVGERAYWTWVGTVNRTPEAALDAGLALLAQRPEQHRLYLRLAELCRARDAAERCAAALESVAPPDARAAAHRDAALALLEDADDAWNAVARGDALDPALARRLVDRARAAGGDDALAAYEAAWRERLAEDSTAAGAAFGLGYAAALAGAWDDAERLLRRVAELRPDDVEAYRELGRVYFFTGEPAAFRAALQSGIRAARAGFDVEGETILRGNLGLNYLQRGVLDSAEVLFKHSLATSRALSDEATEGFNLYRLASVRLQQHRFDEVFPLLDSAAVRYAVHAPRQAAEVTTLRGTTYSELYRYGAAETELERAIAEADAANNLGVVIQASVALAQVRMRMGRYAAAHEAAADALDLARRYRQVHAETNALLVLGDVAHRMGQYEDARGYYEAVADAAGATAVGRTALQRLARTAVGMGDAAAAQRHLDALAEQLPADSTEHALFDLSLSVTYGSFGNHEEAIVMADRAIARLDGGERHADLVDALLRKAWLQSEDNVADADYRRTEALIRRAAGISARHYPEGVMQSEAALGNVYLNWGRYEQARTHLEAALQMERRVRRPYQRIHLLHGLALAAWRLGDDDAAERFFQASIETVETLREGLGERQSRATFVQNDAVIDVYKNYAAFLNGRARIEEAFHYVERGRSRSLADLLHTTQQGRRLDPATLSGRMIEAQRQKTDLARALAEAGDARIVPASANGGDATRLGQLRREYLRADSAYTATRTASLGAREPMAAMLTAAPVRAESVQAMLREGEAMIVYNLWDGRADHPLKEIAGSSAFVITPRSVRAVAIDANVADLTETVEFYRGQLGDPEGGDFWRATGQRLYAQLVAPVQAVLPAGTKHLHIVPEGALHYIPFGALQDARGRFLAESYALSVVPSASVLGISRAMNPGRWRSILLVADPNGRLPGTRREVNAIANMPTLRPLELTGDQATLENVTAFAGQYDVIHIATHGTFTSHAPLASHLELHGDEVLRVEQIGALDLDAYLVTLSACETALSGGFTSDIPKGEEWIGLNQAFLAAGTPTVMASLWPIDDRVSSEFMMAFYEHLQQGMNKSEALAAVQRRFARRADVGHPFYWAAFTVVGDPL